MSTLTSVFQSIANSIRNVTGLSNTITPVNFSTVLNNFSNIVYICEDYCNNTSFNGRVSFGDTDNLYDALYNKQAFDREVYIPNTVTNMCHTFSTCSNFNQSITIPSSVIDLSEAFVRCNNFNTNVFIKGTAYRTINVQAMFFECNNSLRKNIWFNINLNNQFNVTNTQSLIGSPITWTDMTNGFYNATRNIYCYYNYAG